MTRPRVIYEPKPGLPLAADPAFTARLARAPDRRTLVDRFVIPPRSGRAWPVRAGHLVRIVAVEGPQVGDFNVWSLANPRERFWAARTRQLHRAHLTTGDRLWSCLPWLRPMLTITADTIAYGLDADGAGCHDLLGTRCDPYVHKLLNGEEYDRCCHSNLVRAVAPWRLGELDVHDVLNVFQVAGLTPDGRYFVKPSPARRGDYLELFAEIDVLCALSACPHGDLSIPVWGPDAADASAVCRPLGVEVWAPAPRLVAGWTPPRPSDYAGLHGLDPTAGDAAPAAARPRAPRQRGAQPFARPARGKPSPGRQLGDLAGRRSRRTR